MSIRPAIAIVLGLTIGLCPRCRHHRQPPDCRLQQARAGETEFRALYKELVEINTTLSVGSCTDGGQRDEGAPLKAAGYRRRATCSHRAARRPNQGNLVALLPGSDESSSRCCCSRISTWSKPIARTGTRSLQARRGRWILLRARRVGRQGHGRGVRRHHGALQERRLRPQARHQAGADLRRGDTQHLQRREIPHRASPGSHRRRLRPQRRRRRPAYDQERRCIVTCGPRR